MKSNRSGHVRFWACIRHADNGATSRPVAGSPAEYVAADVVPGQRDDVEVGDGRGGRGKSASAENVLRRSIVS